MPPTLASKLPDTGTTIFTVMSQLAAQHDAINLSQGFPDFRPPAGLVKRVSHYLEAGANQYAPMTGVPELRNAIASKMADLYGVTVSADAEVTVTSGATEALFCAIHAIVRPGDEVIVFDPAYDSYEPAVALAGGRTVHLPLVAPDFHIDWERFSEALNDRTRLVIINSPHNPTGAVLAASDLDELATRIADNDCFVLSDEVYEHIVFDEQPHCSIVGHPELFNRGIAVFSFGKTYHATGWKIGYAIAPEALTAELRKVHQFDTFTTVTPMQLALADFLQSDPAHYRELPGFYQAKRDQFATLLEDTRFRPLPCAGTYFQLADYSAISDEDDMTFARWLTQTHGVAVIPISVFFEKPPSDMRIVRFCFAKEASTLKAAAVKLCRI
ncbi:MAG: methionine aminotransferase [Pseudomonadota bacterium]